SLLGCWSIGLWVLGQATTAWNGQLDSPEHRAVGSARCHAARPQAVGSCGPRYPGGLHDPCIADTGPTILSFLLSLTLIRNNVGTVSASTPSCNPHPALAIRRTSAIQRLSHGRPQQGR